MRRIGTGAGKKTGVEKRRIPLRKIVRYTVYLKKYRACREEKEKLIGKCRWETKETKRQKNYLRNWLELLEMENMAKKIQKVGEGIY